MVIVVVKVQLTRQIPNIVIILETTNLYKHDLTLKSIIVFQVINP